MENINEEKLQELGIFEIRNIAREVGVYSPTLLKKNELIEKIMRVITGKDVPYIKKTKQGRPPKNISSINNFVDVFVPSHIFDETKDESSFSKFNDINESINVEEYGSNEKLCKGLVKVYEDYSLLFYNVYKEDKNNVVFINNNQTKFYNLKTGDFISVKAIYIDDNKPLVLKEIYSINEKSFIKDCKREDDFYSKVAIYPNSKIKTNIYNNDDEIFEKLDLFTPCAKGQRILLKSIHNNFSYQILHRFTTSNNNLSGLAILINENPENYFEVSSNNNFQCITNNFNNSNNLLLEIEVKVNALKRKVEQGEDVVLFINSLENLTNYISNQNILNKVSKEEAIINAEQYVNDLILLGKNTQNGSLTILANADENYSNNSLFNNIVVLNEQKYEILLNTELSNTIGIEKILSKSELEKLRNYK